MRSRLGFTDSRRWRLLMGSVLVLGCAWILLTRPAEGAMSSAAAPSPREGFTAPEFDLTRLDGREIRLLDLRGQSVVLNFWASWCPPCRAEMPDLETLHDEYAGRGVVVLGVNSTIQDDEQAARGFASELQLTFPIALDADGEVTRAYMVQALPSTYFIGRDGVIRRVLIGGPLSRSVLETVVLDLLEEGN